MSVRVEKEGCTVLLPQVEPLLDFPRAHPSETKLTQAQRLFLVMVVPVMTIHSGDALKQVALLFKPLVRLLPVRLSLNRRVLMQHLRCLS